MAIEIKHTFQSAKTNSPDATRVQPSNWNANHTMTLAGGKVVGKVAGIAGTAEELPISVDATGQSLIPPTGTSAQRPLAALAGMIRFNTTIPGLEIFQGGVWAPFNIGALAQNLQSLAGLSLTADRGIYSTGTGTVGLFPFTALARALLDDADAAAMRATISAQPADPDLTAIAALAGVGFIARTANNTWAQRTLTAGSGITVLNGDGVLGNPGIGVRAVGISQSWQDVRASRALLTAYQNLTLSPIMVAIGGFQNVSTAQFMQVSVDAITWQNVARSLFAVGGGSASFIVPVNHYYRGTNSSGVTTIDTWTELR